MEGTSEGAPRGPLAHLEEVAGYALKDIAHSADRPCTQGGVVVHASEAVELFNLLEANPRTWNHRLRSVLAGWILHLVKEGKIEGHFEGSWNLRETGQKR